MSSPPPLLFFLLLNYHHLRFWPKQSPSVSLQLLSFFLKSRTHFFWQKTHFSKSLFSVCKDVILRATLWGSFISKLSSLSKSFVQFFFFSQWLTLIFLCGVVKSASNILFYSWLFFYISQSWVKVYQSHPKDSLWSLCKFIWQKSFHRFHNFCPKNWVDWSVFRSFDVTVFVIFFVSFFFLIRCILCQRQFLKDFDICLQHKSIGKVAEADDDRLLMREQQRKAISHFLKMIP